jgi:hypothetical protein
VVVYTGRYLCAGISVSTTSSGLLLFVVYHHAHGGNTNKLTMLHIYFPAFIFWFRMSRLHM